MNEEMIDKLDKHRLAHYTPRNEDYVRVSVTAFKKLIRFYALKGRRIKRRDDGHDWEIIALSGWAEDYAKKQLSIN